MAGRGERCHGLGAACVEWRVRAEHQLAGGTEGQLLVGTLGAPVWSSSPTIGGIAVAGTAQFGGNVGIGINPPQSKLHVLSMATSGLPPRAESWGTSGFAAGWDFYQNRAPRAMSACPMRAPASRPVR